MADEWFEYSRGVDDTVPSPAGWEPPAGSKPGWDWTPPAGAELAYDDAPWWLRTMVRLPLVDRRAHVLLWERGGFRVFPPDHPAHQGTSGA